MKNYRQKLMVQKLSQDTLILPGTEFLKSLEVIVFSRILKLTKKARRVKRLTKNE